MDLHSSNQQEKKNIYILRETKAKFKNIAVLIAEKKDGSLLLSLCQKAFFGKMPFPVIHTGKENDFKKVVAEGKFDALLMPNTLDLAVEIPGVSLIKIDLQAGQAGPNAQSEEQKREKEEVMQRLRQLGYM